MATTVHIPKALLTTVDSGARRERISRNRFIVRALEQALREKQTWSADFFAQLTPLDPRDARVVEEMLEAIRSAQTLKRSPKL